MYKILKIKIVYDNIIKKQRNRARERKRYKNYKQFIK